MSSSAAPQLQKKKKKKNKIKKTGKCNELQINEDPRTEKQGSQEPTFIQQQLKLLHCFLIHDSHFEIVFLITITTKTLQKL